MEVGKTVVTFVKYSERMYLESFQRGEMYCNDIQYFAKADERNGIGDIHEDVYKISFGKGAPVVLN